jgi:putative glutamine amidotransferase
MTTVRPLIGLSGRRKQAHEIAGFPANMDTAPIDVYVAAYAQAVTEAGGLPVHLPGHVEPREYAGVLDGILLSGGTDLDPARYGAAPDPSNYAAEPERDAFEFALVDLAIERDLPVLGICRGLQVLNVWAGGSLHQDLPPHARYDLDAGVALDEVTFQPASRLHALYGERRGINSLHHQAVDRVGEGFDVVGRSVDGTVEALEWAGHDVIAVQWHPELMPERATDPVFRWLVDRAAARAARRTGAVIDA